MTMKRRRQQSSSNNNNKKKRSQLQAAEIISSEDNQKKKKKMKMTLNNCSTCAINPKGDMISTNNNTSTKMKMLNRCSSRDKKKRALIRCSTANPKGEISSNNNSSYAIVDHDFLVNKILSRLPVKSLMRFKSVSKRWGSSITYDPRFHQLHYDHSGTCPPLLRRLAISSVASSGYREIIRYRVSDAKVSRGVAYHTFHESQYMFPVHGLVCMLDWPKEALRIYNPSTRKETQWINIPTKNSRILFGFDPVTKKHKVLCRGTDPKTCEVWTVGENSWRRIDYGHDVPKDNIKYGRSIYLNGAIYWMERISSGKKMQEMQDSGTAQVLVAFDVASEKFRVIPFPDYIVNQPRDESYWYVHIKRGRPFTDHLLEVNGHLALLRGKNKNTVTMWMSENDHHDNWNWSEVVITLPFEWVGKETYVLFYNVPGTDQIVMKTNFDRTIRGISAYSHNWKKNSSEKRRCTGKRVWRSPRSRVGKPTTATATATRCTHFRESIFPVN